MKRALLAVVGLAVLGGIIVGANLGAIAKRAMSPKGVFDPARAPPAPDYGDDAQWTALPAKRDKSADVFYVHPTTYLGSEWNGPTTDAALNAATDRVATHIQAPVFDECCAVYGPRYRQANGMAFTDPSTDGERALDLAYSDVTRAFAAFQARRGSDRPFLIASHSQGSVLAARLVSEVVAPSALKEKLVAAYVIGGEIGTSGLDPCRSPDDLHCMVGYNARGPGFVPNAFAMKRPLVGERLCTNPLTWTNEPAGVDRNLGAVFLEADDKAPRPGFASARCERGTLVVEHIGKAPRDLASTILDHVLGEGNYHAIEYQTFFMNLRENANRRVRAFTR